MPLTKRTRKRWLDCEGMTMAEAEQYGTQLAELQRDIMFMVGDLARYAAARWPDRHHQVWPEWVSPGMLARASAVCAAYPREQDRQAEATYTIYMTHANSRDRLARVAGHVDAGRTSDEARKHTREQRESTPAPAFRWLLAIDVHYFLHRFWFSGAGVEAAQSLAQWIRRTVDRMKEKGVTDVVCAFDSKSSKRKLLTLDWPDKYKDRPPKDLGLIQQLQLIRELLEHAGHCCVEVEGYESDDVLASYAAQFPGRVTLLTQDKDVRQCLSERVNILLDVEWLQDDTSGDMLPDYKWLTAKGLVESTSLRPDQWIDYQTIMGDAVDGIKGVAGIGEKGAKDLVIEFGSVESAIEAAKAGDEGIKPAKRAALIEFEDKLAVTRQLVTLVTTLEVPRQTRV